MATESYQQLLDTDSRDAPPVMREDRRTDLGSDPIAAERYVGRDFFELEKRHMWTKVWQMACREEDIAELGDIHVHEIVDQSILVIRTESGAIRAFHNSCLHRGRRLLDESGRVENLRCGFHGWTWDLDGELKSLPCRWDFAHLTDAELALPEVKVGLWGGFVFINLDPDAMPLADYLGALPAHFERWKLEDCYKAAHVARVIRCNWKIAQEAFMESYHVVATHPQILPIFADTTAEYDIYGDHVNRNLAAFAEPSPHLAERPSRETVIAGMLDLWGRKPLADMAASDTPAREVLGDIARRSFAKATKRDMEDVTDAELLDAIVYNVFPNFAPWGGFAPNIVYRWRPNGNDVDSCIMEVVILKRVPEGEERPKPVPVHWLTEEEEWACAKELPALGPVIDQDMGNMPSVHKGLKASGTRKVHLGLYMEGRIRHFHQTLDKYIERGQRGD